MALEELEKMRHLQGMFFSRPINASDTPAAQDEADSTDLKPEKDLGEEDYTISSELIQAIKEQYLEKREESAVYEVRIRTREAQTCRITDGRSPRMIMIMIKRNIEGWKRQWL